MTEQRPNVTMRDLMNRIDQMEAKIVQPPKPSFNDLLRERAKETVGKNRRTMDTQTLLSNPRKEGNK